MKTANQFLYQVEHISFLFGLVVLGVYRSHRNLFNFPIRSSTEMYFRSRP